MKQTKKKLTVKRDTLRDLSSQQVTKVVGGVAPSNMNRPSANGNCGADPTAHIKE